jgi:hypothetical protein
MASYALSFEEITQLGEKFYLDHREILEQEHMGEFAVIDVETSLYQVDQDRLAAIEKAKKAFGDKLFYIIQIGSFQHSSLNYAAGKYAWNF